jgi:PP-loop superfamily ATP-utilizing enzyme
MKTEKLNKIEIISENFDDSFFEKIISVKEKLNEVGFDLNSVKLQIFFSERNPKTLEEIYEQRNIGLL